MGGKPKTENTKKVAGNAKKAEAAAAKQAVADAKSAAVEDDKWSKGSKANKKADDAAAKAEEAARKKAEKAALLAAEEKDQPDKPKGANKKSAEKKVKGAGAGAGAGAVSGGLDLGQLDGDDADSTKKSTAINASGIDNALDALSLTAADTSAKIDRHPERRFKAAYKAFEERRLPEVESEFPGLRKQQRIEIVRKEFDKSEENPFNQANVVGYDASKDDVAKRKKEVREGVERRLGEK